MMGKACMPKMINNIADCGVRNQLILALVCHCIRQNRKLLLLSDRREHLEVMYHLVEPYATVGFYVGGMKQRSLKESEACQVILGTYAMSAEGLDIPDLNTVIFMTPKSSIEQSIGRIIRKDHAVVPTAFDIVDCFSVFAGQSRKRNAVYKKLGYDTITHPLYVDSEFTHVGMYDTFLAGLEDRLAQKRKQVLHDNDNDNEDDEHGVGSSKKPVCLIDDE